MSFILSAGNVISFADYDDVTSRDQRLFEANEGIADSDMIEDFLIRSTQRILYMVKDTAWWKQYYLSHNPVTNSTLNGQIDYPLPNANLFKARQADWTELTTYLALYEYILPKIADFSNQDSAEYRKIGFYDQKFRMLFDQLISAGDWYDWGNEGSVTAQERMPIKTNLVRVR